MKKSILSLLAWSLPFLLLAQNNASTRRQGSGQAPLGITERKGIQWITGLSWEQIKQKAKAENKYLFIDAYTTWCGPCKMMDKYVYPNDTVGDFFNKYFLAVKVQMDKTEKDDQSIKDWYNDSKRIANEYAVTSYPSLIFLSPESTPLYKIQGFRPVQKFVDTAKLVMTNGTLYNDPYKEYRALVSEYKLGVKYYDRMPSMISTAFYLNDSDLAREMFKDHLSYACTLNKNERYTKENIELWSSLILKLDSKALPFFLKDYSIIDQVMEHNGWSINQVNKTIQGRIVDSFFKMQKGETRTRLGIMPNSEVMFKQLPRSAGGKIDPDFVEADWKKLKKMICKHFSKEYADRNVFIAKTSWYYQHENMVGLSNAYFSQLDKYPPEDLVKELGVINQRAWETFLYVNDKKLLNKALEWMDRLIQHGANQPNMLDTYANLLYKLGHINEAIQWQEKAVKLSPNDKSLFKTFEQIKKGEPTYLEQGAIWPKGKY